MTRSSQSGAFSEIIKLGIRGKGQSFSESHVLGEAEMNKRVGEGLGNIQAPGSEHFCSPGTSHAISSCDSRTWKS
jgi:hypothetical protein